MSRLLRNKQDFFFEIMQYFLDNVKVPFIEVIQGELI